MTMEEVMGVLEVIMEVCSEDMIMGLEVMEVKDLEDIMTMIMTFLEAVARKSIKTKRTNIRGIMDSVRRFHHRRLNTTSVINIRDQVTRSIGLPCIRRTDTWIKILPIKLPLNGKSFTKRPALVIQRPSR